MLSHLASMRVASDGSPKKQQIWFRGYSTSDSLCIPLCGPNLASCVEFIRLTKGVYVAGVTLRDRTRAHTSDMCAGKVALVAVASASLSQEHCASFARAALETHGANPHFRYVQVCLPRPSAHTP